VKLPTSVSLIPVGTAAAASRHGRLFDVTAEERFIMGTGATSLFTEPHARSTRHWEWFRTRIAKWTLMEPGLWGLLMCCAT